MQIILRRAALFTRPFTGETFKVTNLNEAREAPDWIQDDDYFKMLKDDNLLLVVGQFNPKEVSLTEVPPAFYSADGTGRILEGDSGLEVKNGDTPEWVDKKTGKTVTDADREEKAREEEVINKPLPLVNSADPDTYETPVAAKAAKKKE
jgi:hypothetical protein